MHIFWKIRIIINSKAIVGVHGAEPPEARKVFKNFIKNSIIKLQNLGKFSQI